MPAPGGLATGASRRRSTFLWIAAVALTLAAAAYQRLSGPSYAARGSVTIGATELTYRLDRSHGGPGDHEVRVAVPDDRWQGALVFRRYPMSEPWSAVSMTYRDGHLTGQLPHQPPAGKVAYRVFLAEGGPVNLPRAPADLAAAAEAATGVAHPAGSAGTAALPPAGPLVLRFRGAVPAAIMGSHILIMFLAMLWSNRAGMEALRGRGGLMRHSSWSLGLMVLGGLIFGPAMQWYAFGEFWTGFPKGHDLTDTKTLVACLAWLAAVFALRRGGQRSRWWVLGAAIVTLGVFLIPHSVMGSELDYGAATVGQ
jgi:hypothetical protein